MFRALLRKLAGKLSGQVSILHSYLSMYVPLHFLVFDDVHLTCEHDQNAHEKALLMTQMLRKLDYNRAQAGCDCPLLQVPIFIGISLLISMILSRAS